MFAAGGMSVFVSLAVGIICVHSLPVSGQLRSKLKEDEAKKIEELQEECSSSNVPHAARAHDIVYGSDSPFKAESSEN
jgi:hypothetical protein